MRRSSRLWLPRAGHHVACVNFDFRSGRAAIGSQTTHTATPEQTPSVYGTTIAARWSLEIVPAASLKTIGKKLAMPVSLSASGNQARFVLVSAFILGMSVAFKRLAQKMLLRDVFSDPRNSLRAKQQSINRPEFRRITEQIRSYRFWSRNPGEPQLWEHQRAALCMAAAYLTADSKPLPGETGLEAALVKMATGTGKSAVIGVLSRCFPVIRRVLILTPREALRIQIFDYVRRGMWAAFGMPLPRGNEIFSDSEGGACGRPVSIDYVAELLPSKLAGILRQLNPHEDPDGEASNQGRVVLAGTLQALDQIRRRSLDPNPRTSAEPAAFIDALRSFDLIIVDEGHYEPAISWSRAVREADRPTILFSATPYRNDYKSFRVRGRFVFNQPITEAWSQHIIRTPAFLPIDLAIEHQETVEGITSAQGSDEEDGRDEVLLDGKTTESVRSFAKLLVARLASLGLEQAHPNPKIMVRADSRAKLKLLQGEIERLIGEKPVLVHDAESGSDHHRRRYKKVASARSHEGNQSARYWLHQTKLLEGVDDPGFVVVAIYDAFGTARQLVQQIGRILRSSDPKRATPQSAFVLAPRRRLEEMERSWSQYLAFEEHCKTNVQHVVISEAALPDRLLENLPGHQYVSSEFRPRFLLDGLPRLEDIRLPTNAAVFAIDADKDPEASGVPIDVDLRKFLPEIEEAILSRDRFKPMRVQAEADALCVIYYGWRSSPYLARQFFPEWTLGVCVLVKSGQIVLAHDTEGIVFDGGKLGLRRVDPTSLAKMMPPSSAEAPVRITRVSSASLDTSRNAVRNQAVRTHSFEEFFSDFSTYGMVPTSAFGFIGGRGRYLGFARARVRDVADGFVPYERYREWAKGVAAEFDASKARNPVFVRYAQVAQKLGKDDGVPLNVLLDIYNAFDDFTDPADAGHQTHHYSADHDDLCADVQNENEKRFFEVMIDKKQFRCEIAYNPDTGRYAISSDDLDKHFEAKEASALRRRSSTTLTERLNKEQSFRIIPAAQGLVYASGRFYRPRLDAREDGTLPTLDNVVAVPVLRTIFSEKGENIFSDREAWRRESFFGLMEAMCEHPSSNPLPVEWGELGQLISRFDLVVCDDDGQEIADFIGLDTSSKVACMIHAKASSGISHASVGAIQEVGRQAQASLAFCATTGKTPTIGIDRLKSNVRANKVELPGRSRIFKNTKKLSLEEIQQAISNGLPNRSWNREIWITASRLMDRDVIEKNFTNRDNRALQLLMYLEAMTAACSRGNVRLRFFCHGSESEP